MTPEGFQRIYSRKCQKWGLAKDEFTDNATGHIRSYVGEASGMIGEFVMNAKMNC